MENQKTRRDGTKKSKADNANKRWRKKEDKENGKINTHISEYEEDLIIN